MRGSGNEVKGDGMKGTNQDKSCTKRDEVERRGDEAREARPVGKGRRHERGKVEVRRADGRIASQGVRAKVRKYLDGKHDGLYTEPARHRLFSRTITVLYNHI